MNKFFEKIKKIVSSILLVIMIFSQIVFINPAESTPILNHGKMVLFVIDYRLWDDAENPENNDRMASSTYKGLYDTSKNGFEHLTIKERIERLASYIQNNEGYHVHFLVVNKINSSVNCNQGTPELCQYSKHNFYDIFKYIQKLYNEKKVISSPDSTVYNLEGVIFFGDNIDMPIVQEGKEIKKSIAPFLDLENSAFIYDKQNNFFKYSGGKIHSDLFHSVIVSSNKEYEEVPDYTDFLISYWEFYARVLDKITRNINGDYLFSPENSHVDFFHMDLNAQNQAFDYSKIEGFKNNLLFWRERVYSVFNFKFLSFLQRKERQSAQDLVHNLFEGEDFENEEDKHKLKEDLQNQLDKFQLLYENSIEWDLDSLFNFMGNDNEIPDIYTKNPILELLLSSNEILNRMMEEETISNLANLGNIKNIGENYNTAVQDLALNAEMHVLQLYYANQLYRMIIDKMIDEIQRDTPVLISIDPVINIPLDCGDSDPNSIRNIYYNNTYDNPFFATLTSNYNKPIYLSRFDDFDFDYDFDYDYEDENEEEEEEEDDDLTEEDPRARDPQCLFLDEPPICRWDEMSEFDNISQHIASITPSCGINSRPKFGDNCGCIDEANPLYNYVNGFNLADYFDNTPKNERSIEDFLIYAGSSQLSIGYNPYDSTYDFDFGGNRTYDIKQPGNIFGQVVRQTIADNILNLRSKSEGGLLFDNNLLYGACIHTGTENYNTDWCNFDAAIKPVKDLRGSHLITELDNVVLEHPNIHEYTPYELEIDQNEINKVIQNNMSYKVLNKFNLKDYDGKYPGWDYMPSAHEICGHNPRFPFEKSLRNNFYSFYVSNILMSFCHQMWSEEFLENWDEIYSVVYHDYPRPIIYNNIENEREICLEEIEMDCIDIPNFDRCIPKVRVSDIEYFKLYLENGSFAYIPTNGAHYVDFNADGQTYLKYYYPDLFQLYFGDSPKPFGESIDEFGTDYKYNKGEIEYKMKSYWADKQKELNQLIYIANKEAFRKYLKYSFSVWQFGPLVYREDMRVLKDGGGFPCITGPNGEDFDDYYDLYWDEIENLFKQNCEVLPIRDSVRFPYEYFQSAIETGCVSTGQLDDIYFKYFQSYHNWTQENQTDGSCPSFETLPTNYGCEAYWGVAPAPEVTNIMNFYNNHYSQVGYSNPVKVERYWCHKGRTLGAIIEYSARHFYPEEFFNIYGHLSSADRNDPDVKSVLEVIERLNIPEPGEAGSFGDLSLGIGEMAQGIYFKNTNLTTQIESIMAGDFQWREGICNTPNQFDGWVPEFVNYIIDLGGCTIVQQLGLVPFVFEAKDTRKMTYFNFSNSKWLDLSYPEYDGPNNPNEDKEYNEIKTNIGLYEDLQSIGLIHEDQRIAIDEEKKYVDKILISVDRNSLDFQNSIGNLNISLLQNIDGEYTIVDGIKEAEFEIEIIGCENCIKFEDKIIVRNGVGNSLFFQGDEYGEVKISLKLINSSDLFKNSISNSLTLYNKEFYVLLDVNTGSLSNEKILDIQNTYDFNILLVTDQIFDTEDISHKNGIIKCFTYDENTDDWLDECLLLNNWQNQNINLEYGKMNKISFQTSNQNGKFKFVVESQNNSFSKNELLINIHSDQTSKIVFDKEYSSPILFKNTSDTVKLLIKDMYDNITRTSFVNVVAQGLTLDTNEMAFYNGELIFDISFDLDYECETNPNCYNISAFIDEHNINLTQNFEIIDPDKIEFKVSYFDVETNNPVEGISIEKETLCRIEILYEDEILNINKVFQSLNRDGKLNVLNEIQFQDGIAEVLVSSANKKAGDAMLTLLPLFKNIRLQILPGEPKQIKLVSEKPFLRYNKNDEMMIRAYMLDKYQNRVLGYTSELEEILTSIQFKITEDTKDYATLRIVSLNTRNEEGVISGRSTKLKTDEGKHIYIGKANIIAYIEDSDILEGIVSVPIRNILDSKDIINSMINSYFYFIPSPFGNFWENDYTGGLFLAIEKTLAVHTTTIEDNILIIRPYSLFTGSFKNKEVGIEYNINDDRPNIIFSSENFENIAKLFIKYPNEFIDDLTFFDISEDYFQKKTNDCIVLKDESKGKEHIKICQGNDDFIKIYLLSDYMKITADNNYEFKIIFIDGTTIANFKFDIRRFINLKILSKEDNIDDILKSGLYLKVYKDNIYQYEYIDELVLEEKVFHDNYDVINKGYGDEDKSLLLLNAGNSVGRSTQYMDLNSINLGNPFLRFPSKLESSDLGYTKDIGILLANLRDDDLLKFLPFDYNCNTYKDLLLVFKSGKGVVFLNQGTYFQEYGEIFNYAQGIEEIYSLDLNKNGCDDLLFLSNKDKRIYQVENKNKDQFFNQDLKTSILDIENNHNIYFIAVEDLNNNDYKDILINHKNDFGIHYAIPQSIIPTVENKYFLKESISVLGKDFTNEEQNKYDQIIKNLNISELEFDLYFKDSSLDRFRFDYNYELINDLQVKYTKPDFYDDIYEYEISFNLNIEQFLENNENNILQLGFYLPQGFAIIEDSIDNKNIQLEEVLANNQDFIILNKNISSNEVLPIQIIFSLKILEKPLYNFNLYENKCGFMDIHVHKSSQNNEMTFLCGQLDNGGKHDIYNINYVKYIPNNTEFEYPNWNSDEVNDLYADIDNLNEFGIPNEYFTNNDISGEFLPESIKSKLGVEDIEDLKNLVLLQDTSCDGIPDLLDSYPDSSYSQFGSRNIKKNTARDIYDRSYEIYNSICSSTAGCVSLPINYAFLASGYQTMINFDPNIGIEVYESNIPVRGHPVFCILPSQPYVSSGGGCFPTSTFRFYVMPTLTGGMGIATCVNPPDVGLNWPDIPLTGNCFLYTFRLTDGEICETNIGEDMSEYINNLKNISSNFQKSGDVGVINIHGGIGGSNRSSMQTYDQQIVEFTNIRPTSFPAGIIETLLNNQIDEIINSLTDPMVIKILLPNIINEFRHLNLGNMPFKDDFWNIVDVMDAVGKLDTVIDYINVMPIINIHRKTINIYYPDVDPHYMDMKIIEYENWVRQAEYYIDNYMFEADQANIAQNAISRVKSNIMILRQWKEFPNQIQKLLTYKNKVLERIVENMNTLFEFYNTLANGIREKLTKWKLYLLVFKEKIIDPLQNLIEMFRNYSIDCTTCTNDRLNAMSWQFKLFEYMFQAAFPDAIIEIPTLPDITIDLSSIDPKIDIELPDFDFYPLKLTLPRLPNVRGIRLGLDLDTNIPLLPAPPNVLDDLPLPEKIPTLEIDLDFIPEPKEIPDIFGELTNFINMMKRILDLWCKIIQTFVVPEKTLKGEVESRTQRRGFIPNLDFMDIGANLVISGINIRSICYTFELFFKYNLHLDMLGNVRELADIINDKILYMYYMTQGGSVKFEDVTDTSQLNEHLDIEYEDRDITISSNKNPPYKIESYFSDLNLKYNLNLAFDSEYISPQLSKKQKKVLSYLEEEINYNKTLLQTFEKYGIDSMIKNSDQYNVILTSKTNYINDVYGIFNLDIQNVSAQSLNIIPSPGHSQTADTVYTETRYDINKNTLPHQNNIYIYNENTGQIDQLLNYTEGFDQNTQVLIYDFFGTDKPQIIYNLQKDVFIKGDYDKNSNNINITAIDSSDPYLGNDKNPIPKYSALGEFNINYFQNGAKIEMQNIDEDVLGYLVSFYTTQSDYYNSYIGDANDKIQDTAYKHFVFYDLKFETEVSNNEYIQNLKNLELEVLVNPNSFNIELEEGKYYMAITGIYGDTELDISTKSLLTLVQIQEVPNFIPPQASTGTGSLIQIPMGETIILDGTYSESKNEIVKYWWDTDVYKDTDGDGDPENDKDIIGERLEIGPYNEIKNDFIVLNVKDEFGMIGSKKISIVVIPTEIYIDSIKNNEIKGYIEIEDEIEFGLITSREGGNFRLKQDGKDIFISDKDGKFSMKFEESEYSIILYDNENNEILGINDLTGKLYLLDENYYFDVLVGNETDFAKIVLYDKNNNEILYFEYYTEPNFDVNIVNNLSDLKTNLDEGKIYVLDVNLQDNYIIYQMPSTANYLDGGVLFLDLNQNIILGGINKFGNIFALDDRMTLHLNNTNDSLFNILDIKIDDETRFKKSIFPVMKLYEM